MTNDEFLIEYEAALIAQAKAETAVKVMEMRAKLNCEDYTTENQNRTPKRPRRKTRIEKYIEQMGDSLTVDELDFLEREERSPKEVAAWLSSLSQFKGITSDTVCRKLKPGGELRPGKSNNPQPRGKRTVDSISVIEMVHNIDGDPRPAATIK